MIRNDKATWFTIIIGIIIASIFLMFGEKEASLVIYYDEYPDNMITQIFFDTGSGYSEKQSISCKASKKTELSIDNQYISFLKGLRIDFSNKEGQVDIRRIELRKNGLIVESLKPEDIIEEIDSVVNVDYVIDSDKLVINNATIDGQILFNNDLIHKMNNIKRLNYKEIFILVFFLAIVSLLVYNRRYINCELKKHNILCKRKD